MGAISSILSMLVRALTLRARAHRLSQNLSLAVVWVCAATVAVAGFLTAMSVLTYLLLEPYLGAPGAAGALAGTFALLAVGAAWLVHRHWRNALAAVGLAAPSEARRETRDADAPLAAATSTASDAIHDMLPKSADMTTLAGLAALGVIVGLCLPRDRPTLDS